jgi:hypothetical protein
MTLQARKHMLLHRADLLIRQAGTLPRLVCVDADRNPRKMTAQKILARHSRGLQPLFTVEQSVANDGFASMRCQGLQPPNSNSKSFVAH